METKLSDDDALQNDVDAYFPKALQKAYANDIAHHQLRREIAATVLTNDLVNHAGIRIILTVADHGAENVARAYLLARDAFALPEIWASIEALDNKVSAATQTSMMQTLRNATAKAMQRFLSNSETLAKLIPNIELNRKGLAQLSAWLAKNGDAKVGSKLESQNVPQAVAQCVARLPIMVSALDLVNLSVTYKMRVDDLAEMFFGFEERLGLGWLNKIAHSTAPTPWQRDAIAAALAELADNHSRLTAQLATRAAKGKKLSIEQWAATQITSLERYDAMLAEWRMAGTVDLAMLQLANERLSALSA
jgi:glutamate dehydrogenase